MAAKSEEPLLPTGIPGMDMICGGGFPKGGIVMILGDTGTGKTTLAYEFLVRGALQGENGMLITSNAPVEKYVSQLMPFEFREGDVPGKGITIMPMNCDHMDLEGYLEVIGGISKAAKDLKAKRVTIDPFPRSLLELSDPDLVTVLNALSDAFYKNGLTAVAVTDLPNPVEMGMADGLILTGADDREGDMLRTIQVVKMRGAEHSLSRYGMYLSREGTVMTRILRRSVE